MGARGCWRLRCPTIWFAITVRITDIVTAPTVHVRTPQARVAPVTQRRRVAQATPPPRVGRVQPDVRLRRRRVQAQRVCVARL